MADDLMQKFSVLGTTDHDVLIKQLQEYLNYQLSPSGCEFFLDMNNWLVLSLIAFLSTSQMMSSQLFIVYSIMSDDY